MKTKWQKKTVGSLIFDVFNYIFLAFCAVIAVVPFLYVIAGSFATEAELATRPFFLIPREPSLNAYKYILSSKAISRSFLNSVYITIFGTIINLFFTFTMAYPLSKNYLMGRNWILNAVIFCMLFSGGMIPNYLLVKNLKLLDTYWSLWLPGAISPFNLFIIKNFFQGLPSELEESAKIDGCTDIEVLLKIVLPLSKPIIATFTLFYAVGHWNAFFSSLMYINDSSKWPLQVILRNLVLLSSGVMVDYEALDPAFVKPPEEAIKMAVIVVGTVPILLVYPFLQKYFTKGVLVGSLKG